MTQTLGVGHAFVLDQAERLAAQGRVEQGIAMLLPSLEDRRPPPRILVRLSQWLGAVGGAETGPAGWLKIGEPGVPTTPACRRNTW